MTKHDDFEGKAIDYLLGELDEVEAREFEAALDAPKHQQDAQELAEYQALTAAATRALALEQKEGLSPEQHLSLLEQARQSPDASVLRLAGKAGGKDGGAAPTPHFSMRTIGFISALCAASILLAVAYTQFVPHFQERREQQAALDLEKQELLMRITRLPEGYERYVIDDINSPAAWAPMQLQDQNLNDPQVRDRVKKDLAIIEQRLGHRLKPLSGEPTEAVASVPQAPEKLEQAARLNESSARAGGLQNVEVGGAIRVRGEWADVSDFPSIATPAQAGAAPEPVAEPSSSPPAETITLGREGFPVGVGASGSGGFGRGGGGFGGGGLGQVPAAAPVPQSTSRSVTIGAESNGVWGTDFRSNQITGFDSSGLPALEQLRSLGYSDGGGGFDGGGFRPRDWSYRQSGQEQYQAAQEQPVVTVAQQPLSTFSIDVDTASYSNIRRMLNQGQWPPADAVRIEEMINYFDYTYAFTGSHDRGESHPFHVNVDLATCPWAPERVLARVGLQGKDVPRGERPPANLVFLIDVSGSMRPPNRLPLVKESMKALLETLQPEDRVGIVTYAGDARVALPSTSCDGGTNILRAIESLNAGGSTNGEAGIGTAYAMAKANFIEGGINRVILVTDGDFNVGATDAGSLLDLIEQQARGKVFLTVLGFGMGNLKDGRLEELSNKGNGNYAYIDSFAEARKTLVEQVNGTLMTIAKDVKIQVEFNPARVQAYRLIGYDNRVLAARDFNDDTKDAGEIGAGHQVTALYEIVPVGAPMQPGVDPLRYQSPPEAIAPPLPVAPSDEWMTVKLRYKQPEGDVSSLIEVPVTGAPLAMEQVNNTELRFAAAVAAFGLVLRNSEHKGSATLDMALELAKQPEGGFGFHGGDPSGMMQRHQNQRQERQEFVDLVVRAKTLRQ